MFIRKYYGENVKTVLALAKSELGEDLILLSQRGIEDGRVELTVGKDAPDNRIRAERAPVDDHLREIKQMLSALTEERRTAGFGKAALFLYRDLKERGLSEEGAFRVVQDLTQGVPAEELLSRDAVLREMRKFLFSRIRTVEPRTSQGTCMVLLGRTGVGKTTTLAKLVSRERFLHKRPVGIVSLDAGKMGARDELERVGRLLDVPTGVVYERREIPGVLERFRDVHTLFVDTPGSGLKGNGLQENLMDLTILHPGVQFHLLVSPHYQREVLVQDLTEYGRLELTSLIVTKLDESRRLGGLLDAILAHPVPLSWMTTGQEIPDDILPVDKGLLFEMMMED